MMFDSALTCHNLQKMMRWSSLHLRSTSAQPPLHLGRKSTKLDDNLTEHVMQHFTITAETFYYTRNSLVMSDSALTCHNLQKMIRWRLTDRPMKKAMCDVSLRMPLLIFAARTSTAVMLAPPASNPSVGYGCGPHPQPSVGPAVLPLCHWHRQPGDPRRPGPLTVVLRRPACLGATSSACPAAQNL